MFVIYIYFPSENLGRSRREEAVAQNGMRSSSSISFFILFVLFAPPLFGRRSFHRLEPSRKKEAFHSLPFYSCILPSPLPRLKVCSPRSGPSTTLLCTPPPPPPPAAPSSPPTAKETWVPFFPLFFPSLFLLFFPRGRSQATLGKSRCSALLDPATVGSVVQPKPAGEQCTKHPAFSARHSLSPPFRSPFTFRSSYSTLFNSFLFALIFRTSATNKRKV